MTFHYRVIYDVHDQREDWDNLTSRGVPYAFGVQAVVQDDPEVGVEIVYGKDYFIWRYDMWQTVDFNGLTDYLAHTTCAHVLFGRLMPREDWNKLSKRISDQKNGWLPGEEWED
ncbi:hypothetical protein LCGC14_1766740 [marine sediment metagenome]|uniref:Uncharacterized protein n=1 Tax=marine sediment metagenome TaxID=412755 RepID=A0A0F9HLY4_9ZZZZ